jgi:hypothetical protein
VTFEALLTFFGILVAVLAIARPVQRHSLSLFVPVWRWYTAFLLSLILIVCRDAPFGVNPLFGWPLRAVLFGLTLGAFLIPVGVALWSWATWHQATLTGRNIGQVEEIFKTALRERQFDEVERIVRTNQERLTHLPASAATVLFDPVMVTALVDSHSLIHLELLANMQFLRSLENRHGAVDVVVRELLRSDVSPLRSAVIARYGGLEHLRYSLSERALMDRTLQNPKWYFEASAHYPLVISAVEMLRSGKLDTDYNDIGRDYEADQGLSKRSHCPIYLAAKTEVLAIEAALEQLVEEDFYVTDLWDIFSRVLERSQFNQGIWENSVSNHEFPTPYAYLLYSISADLRELSATALQKATSTDATWRAGKPGRVAGDLARTWSLCVWGIGGSGSQNRVGAEFRDRVIEQYLLFVLELGWQPSELFPGGVGGNVEGLDVWRDLFMSELQARFAGGGHTERKALKEAFESLDRGKGYVSKGWTWLEGKLFGKPQTPA